LANSKTQNSFLSPILAMFHHDCTLAVKPASTPWYLHQNKLGEILCLLICSFLLCLSWLLRCQVWKFQRALWITLYNTGLNEKIIMSGKWSRIWKEMTMAYYMVLSWLSSEN
jgi:hypothetical protein